MNRPKSASSSSSRVDAFFRREGLPFDDVRKETFAKELARGGSIPKASELADVNPKTGAAWKGNVAMIDRVRELRDGAETFIGVSKGWIVAQLKLNALGAQEDRKFAESTKTLELLYKILSLDKDMAGNAPSAANGITVTDKEVLKRLRAGRPHAEEPIEAEGQEEGEEDFE